MSKHASGAAAQWADGALPARRGAVGTLSIKAYPEQRLLHLIVTGPLSPLDALDYERKMLAACAELARVRPWGLLSDRRPATVQIPEVEAIMAKMFLHATASGRTHAAVLATKAFAALPLRRLALATGVVQKTFDDEASARAWLARELK